MAHTQCKKSPEPFSIHFNNTLEPMSVQGHIWSPDAYDVISL